jgi:predicted Fe-Mo cluster-binding NifX family protein
MYVIFLLIKHSKKAFFDDFSVKIMFFRSDEVYYIAMLLLLYHDIKIYLQKNSNKIFNLNNITNNYTDIFERFSTSLNYIIILTTTVNIKDKIVDLYQKDKNERLKQYVKTILKWLNNTNIQIVVVENSGYDYSNDLKDEIEKYKDRFEILTFKEGLTEESKYLIDNTSKGDSEIYAINYAYKNSQLIKNNNPVFIIKITGRYFIPELENYLHLCTFKTPIF